MRGAVFAMFFCAALCCGSAAAEAPATSGGRQERFIVAPLAERQAASGADVYVIATETRRFALRAPIGWRVYYDGAARTVTLRQAESEVRITFATGGPRFEAEQWLEELKKRYEEPEVLDRLQLKSLALEATGFDLAWKHGTGVLRTGRFARVSANDFGLEFALVCPSEEFARCLPTLMQVMSTMRVWKAEEQMEVRSFGVE